MGQIMVQMTTDGGYKYPGNFTRENEQTVPMDGIYLFIYW